MHIIKLNAIGSTNTFLKELVSNQVVENFTVVTAEKQLGGRGQMGTKWDSETGKNLIFSIFVEFSEWDLKDAVYLNYAVSLAVYESLKALELPKLSIKWPNDILSDNRKICGILIENSVNSRFLKSTVIGIGLNVNQDTFSEKLGLVDSIKNILGKKQDRALLLDSIVKNLKKELNDRSIDTYKTWKQNYLNVLFKYQKPSMFEKPDGTLFMGKITGVSSVGDLLIELEDESIQYFGLKEVKILR